MKYAVESIKNLFFICFDLLGSGVKNVFGSSEHDRSVVPLLVRSILIAFFFFFLTRCFTPN